MKGLGNKIDRCDELLARLRGCGFLANYHLTAYCRENSADSQSYGEIVPCCPPGGASVCGGLCTSHIPEILEQLPDCRQPAVFRCPVGLLGFAVRIPQRVETSCYIVGCGVREKSLDIYRIEAVSTQAEINPFALLERLQELPIVSEQQVKETAERIISVAASLTAEEKEAHNDRPGVERLKIITALSSSIDQATSSPEILILLQEAIGFLFDVPAIAAAVPDRTGRHFKLEAAWGAPATAGASIISEALSRTIHARNNGAFTLHDDLLQDIIPGVNASFATVRPLAAAGGDVFAALFFFSMEFDEEDSLLVELLTGRAVQRLDRLRILERAERKETASTRLLSMISTLALTDCQQLPDQILGMAAELAEASCGSLMVLDQEQQTLSIKASLGMNPSLLKAMNIKVGTGIAGKVAANGTPLVVNDIEKDERVATANRPRFRTKSFISLPLIFKERVFGVLNLSDKIDDGIFTEGDLEILNPFIGHVACMMQRHSNLEKVELLERLSITDPLTELYNRRFLERRMEEEINRSMRSNTNLTVMLIDLDHFKTYNDICGHIAGDRALKKVASVLRASVRDMDVVTRYGGEEFCILLPGTSKRESIFVAERIRRDIENEFFHGEEHLPHGRLTTSLGISSFPEDGTSSTAIVNSADIALYEAKAGGRNRIVIFNTGSTPEATTPPKFTLLKK